MTLGGGHKPCTVLVYVYEKRLARRLSPLNDLGEIIKHKF